MSGQTKYLKPATYDAIMAVGTSAIQGAKKGKIGSEHSKHLIEEILQAGYSKGWICRQLGYQRSNNLNVSGRITAAKAAKIQALHDDLWMANGKGWRVKCGGGHRIYGTPFRSVCSCYGVSDLEIKRQKDREKKREERLKKAQAC